MEDGLHPRFLHRLLILFFCSAIQGNVLVDGQCFTTSMAGDQLQFGIGHPTVPGQPSDALMPKGMGRGLDSGLLRIFLGDLLHPPGSELAVPSGLQEPAILGMGCDMGSQGSGEGLGEQDIAMLAALALVDENLAVLQVNLGNLNPAQLRNLDPGVEHQPQHDCVLNVFGPIHNLVEMPEFIGSQNAGELRGLFVWPKLALLPNPAAA